MRTLLLRDVRLMLLLCAMLPLFVSGQGQFDPYHYLHFTTNDGLPSSEVYWSMQDQNGYMWFATDHGVVRFDGRRFTTFTQTDGLGDNVILKMAEGPDGRLWFAGLDCSLTVYENGKFRLVEENLQLEQPQTLQHLIPQWMYVKDGENIVVETLKSRLIYNLSTGEVSESFGENHHFTTDGSHAVCIPGRGYVRNEAYPVRVSVTGLPDVVTDIHHARGYVNSSSTQRSALLLADQTYVFAINAVLVMVPGNRDLPVKAINQSETVTFLSHFRGGVMMGLRTHGAFHLNALGDTLASYLPGESVTSCTVDNEGGIWFTTLTEGIYYLQNDAYRTINPEPEKPFTTFQMRAGDSLVAIGEARGDLYGYTPLGELRWRLDGETIKGGLRTASREVLLTYDEEQKAFHWGMISLGLVDERTGIFESIKDFDLEVDQYGMAARTALPVSRGILFAIGHHLALYESLPNRIRGLETGRRIQTLLSGGGDTVWLGHNDGLSLLVDTTLMDFTVEGEHIRCRIDDLAWKDANHDTLLLATKGQGLGLLAGGKLTWIGESDGLASNLINALEVDEAGMIWIGTGQGLSRIQVRGTEVKIGHYNLNHGLPSQEIQDFLIKDGQLWCSTPTLVFTVPVNAVSVNTTTPRVYIIRVMEGDSVRTVDSVLEMHSANQSVRVEFAAIAFHNQYGQRYRYRLLGFNDAWVELTEPSVNFSALPDGQFVLEIEAQNENGDWSQQAAIMEIQVPRPWWKVWWVFSLGVLALVLVTILIFRYFFRRGEKRRLQALRMVEMESRALRAQMNPHFIFNAMNAVQRYISDSDSYTAGHYLAKFSRLVRINLDHSRNSTVLLEDELDALNLYLDFERTRFEDKITFSLEVDEALSKDFSEVPPMLVQPLIENAVIHGLGPKEEGGHVDIRFIRHSDNIIKVTVEDNGVGRSNASPRDDEHQSHGLKITEERLHALLGKRYAEEWLVYEDLTDEKGEATGTRVSLLIPFDERF